MGARANPETIITNAIRAEFQLVGGHVIKLSDSFTRGVPDCLVTMVRNVLVEFKVDKTGLYRTLNKVDIRTYKQLGLTGAQDHHLRAIHSRSELKGAGCITAEVTDPLTTCVLWTPEYSHLEGPQYDKYVPQAYGIKAVIRWLRT